MYVFALGELHDLVKRPPAVIFADCVALLVADVVVRGHEDPDRVGRHWDCGWRWRSAEARRGGAGGARGHVSDFRLSLELERIFFYGTVIPSRFILFEVWISFVWIAQ